MGRIRPTIVRAMAWAADQDVSNPLRKHGPMILAGAHRGEICGAVDVFSSRHMLDRMV